MCVFYIGWNNSLFSPYTQQSQNISAAMPPAKRSRLVPCPCPHHLCCGKKRDHRTVKRHRKIMDAYAENEDRQFDDAAPEADDLPLPLPAANPLATPVLQDLHELMDEYKNNPTEELPNWDQPIAGEAAQGDNISEYPSLGDVVLQTLDWVSAHKSTKSSASDMWQFIRTLLPSNDTMGAYQSLRKILKYHRMETMEKVHVCVNMCVAFTNPKSQELSGAEFQNADETQCPVCQEPRYLADGDSPRRVVYNHPIKFWLQDLFNRKELVPYLLNNIPPKSFPSGHVRRSDGYRQKVTDNPNMADDARNQALSLSADGLPYFKDQQSAGGWAVTIINENLAEGNMGHNSAFVHMACLAPSEFKTQANAHAPIVTTKRYVHMYNHKHNLILLKSTLLL
jgi:hypothetical protein